MFNVSKYTNWYFSIINHAITEHRMKSTDTYYERHHIIPKSLGGDNSKSNLVLLTAREHFLVHWLLTKMVEGTDRYKMASAFISMSRSSKTKQHKREYSSKQFEVMRKVFGRATTERQTGRQLSYETKTKISKGNTGKVRTDEHRQNMSIAHQGKTHSEETKEKLRLMNIGNTYNKGRTNYRHSDETKQKLAVAASNRVLSDDFGSWNKKTYEFINPYGEEIHVSDMKTFCAENNLQSRYMYAVNSGKLEKYKGWSTKKAVTIIETVTACDRMAY